MKFSFRGSKTYHDIDSPRAHNNVDVVRSRAFNSASALSEEDEDIKPVRARKKQRKDSNDEDNPIKGLIQSAQARNESREKHEGEKLKTDQAMYELALRREEREAKLTEQRWQEEKGAREREEERLQNAAKCEAWDRAKRMMNSKNAIIQAKGEQLAKELAALEGIEV